MKEEPYVESEVTAEANPEIVNERYSVATIANDFFKSWPTISK